MLKPKKPEEIEKLKAGGQLLSAILRELSKIVASDIATIDLEKAAQELIKQAGVKPSFLWYRGYPAALCVSVNNVVVHGLPSTQKLKEGDIVSLDLGIWYENLTVDAAVTVGVGKISKDAKRLIEITRKAINVGLKVIKAGNTTGDIGASIQKFIEGKGYKVIKELVGHGVGYAVHEEPQIPNFGQPGEGIKLPENLVIAIEPMATLGSGEVVLADDGFGYKTADNQLAAHFEVTLVVTPKGAQVLTPLDF